MATTYEFNEEMASKADDVALRIDTSGAYIGKFTKAFAVVSQEKGTEGIEFDFETEQKEHASFTLWTRRADGSDIFSQNLVQAMMGLMGIRGLKAIAGKVSKYDADSNKRIEVEGEVFPDLAEKKIGLVLQKELTTNKSGGDGFRINLYGTFDARTKMTASELRERATEPRKLDKMLKSLKDKDSRKPSAASAPGIGATAAPEGNY